MIIRDNQCGQGLNIKGQQKLFHKNERDTGYKSKTVSLLLYDGAFRAFIALICCGFQRLKQPKSNIKTFNHTYNRPLQWKNQAILPALNSFICQYQILISLAVL